MNSALVEAAPWSGPALEGAPGVGGCDPNRIDLLAARSAAHPASGADSGADVVFGAYEFGVACLERSDPFRAPASGELLGLGLAQSQTAGVPALGLEGSSALAQPGGGAAWGRVQAVDGVEPGRFNPDTANARTGVDIARSVVLPALARANDAESGGQPGSAPAAELVRAATLGGIWTC